MKLLFAGTPRFAVPTLEALIDSEHHVAAALTMPDRPKGRGRAPTPSPVKEVASDGGIPVWQPERLVRSEWEEKIHALSVDAAVVVAYGKILKRWFLDAPRIGCVNVHASLLPRHRGPAPIEHAILEGDEVTGITTMMIDEGIDTGTMLLRRELTIDADETAGSLASRLASLGASLLVETLRRLEAGDCPRTAQDDRAATYAPRIEKSTARIDWSAGAARIVRLVRAMNPKPVAWTVAAGKNLRVYAAEQVVGGGATGTVLHARRAKGLVVAAGEGAVRLREVQFPGRKRMGDLQLLAGTSFLEGAPLGGEC